jgi:hypothetical protein
MSAPRKPQLNEDQAARVERAREALEASRADDEPDNYGKHLGRLEAHLAFVFDVIDELTGGAR